MSIWRETYNREENLTWPNGILRLQEARSKSVSRPYECQVALFRQESLEATRLSNRPNPTWRNKLTVFQLVSPPKRKRTWILVSQVEICTASCTTNTMLIISKPKNQEIPDTKHTYKPTNLTPGSSSPTELKTKDLNLTDRKFKLWRMTDSSLMLWNSHNPRTKAAWWELWPTSKMKCKILAWMRVQSLPRSVNTKSCSIN